MAKSFNQYQYALPIYSSSLALQSLCLLQFIFCFYFLLQCTCCYLPVCCLFSSCWLLSSYIICFLRFYTLGAFCFCFYSLYVVASVICFLSAFFMNLLSFSRFFLLQSASLPLPDSTLAYLGS